MIQTLTEKQKNFILDNIDILDNYSLQMIVEKLIDYMKKEDASQLIKEMIEELNDISNYADVGDIY